VGDWGRDCGPSHFSIPKPLLPVGEKAHRAGHHRAAAATPASARSSWPRVPGGADPDVLRRRVRFGVEVTYVHEEAAPGTAGPLSLVRNRIGPDEFFC